MIKKILLLCIISILTIPIYAEENQLDGSLRIDTELNTETIQPQSFYIDENQLDQLFLPKSKNKVQKLQQDEKLKFNQLQQLIFKNSNNIRIEEDYRKLLFQLNQSIKNSERDQILLEFKSNNIPLSTLILGIVGFVIMILSLRFTFKKRRINNDGRKIY